MTDSPERRRVSLWGAIAVVIGNMVGTGVFTSLGFQLEGLRSPSAILLLWLVGGVFALCGALSYAELAAALPRSGGEYQLLSRLYHPAVGFLAGWVSLTVGFAAPVALSAMAFGAYLGGTGGWDPKVLSMVMVLAVTAVHWISIRAGSRFQVMATGLKIALVAVLAAGGLMVAGGQPVRFLPGPGDLADVWSGPFAVSLVYVMYAYAGWNAAAYVAGELRDPERTVPRSLAAGTLTVALLYLLVHAAMLRTTPVEAMRGQVDVARVAAEHVFGERGGRGLAALVGLGMVSSVSAMTWAGPRVAQVMGEDYRLLRPLSRTGADGVPRLALLLQSGVALLLLATSTFEKVLLYISFIVLLSSFLTVAGLMVLRRKEPDLPRPFRVPLYPWPPLAFLALSSYMLIFIVAARPLESAVGLLTLGAGGLIYLVAARMETSPLRSGRD